MYRCYFYSVSTIRGVKRGNMNGPLWDQRVQNLKTFLDSRAAELSFERCLYESYEFRDFWDRAGRSLREQKNPRRNDWLRVGSLEYYVKEFDQPEVGGRLTELISRLESEIPQVDPLNEHRFTDYKILLRLAADEELSEEQNYRHWFLGMYSKSYAAIWESDSGERQSERAQSLITKWENDGFSARQARKDYIALRKGASHLPPPEPRQIRNPRDAELVAAEWMKFWGFDDAVATPVGADQGIDVVCDEAVAQVKAHMVPIGRPDLQNLAGVAAVEGKTALFFALNGFTAQAIEWADKAKMALFTFDLQGEPEPVNQIASQYTTE